MPGARDLALMISLLIKIKHLSLFSYAHLLFYLNKMRGSLSVRIIIELMACITIIKKMQLVVQLVVDKPARVC